MKKIGLYESMLPPTVGNIIGAKITGSDRGMDAMSVTPMDVYITDRYSSTKFAGDNFVSEYTATEKR